MTENRRPAAGGGYINVVCDVIDGDKLTFKCAKCGKDKVIGEVSMQRARTHINLYFCSNTCASALTKALPPTPKKSRK